MLIKNKIKKKINKIISIVFKILGIIYVLEAIGIGLKIISLNIFSQVLLILVLGIILLFTKIECFTDIEGDD